MGGGRESSKSSGSQSVVYSTIGDNGYIVSFGQDASAVQRSEAPGNNNGNHNKERERGEGGVEVNVGF